MRKCLQLMFTCFIFIALISSNVFSQDNGLKERLSKLTQDAAEQYVRPLISGFGADMNSGWISSVPKPSIFGVDINFRIVAMGAFFTNANKTLSSGANFRFNRDEAELLTENVDPNIREQVVDQILSREFRVGIQGPTVVGKKDDYITINFPAQDFTVNGETVSIGAQKFTSDVNGALEDLPVMPLASPQLTLGTVFGTTLALRYLPPIKLGKDLGDVDYFGIGIMHNPAVWFDVPMPVDFAVGIFTETMKVGDMFKSSATQFSLFGGKTFGPSFLNVSPYIGVSVETSTITVNYTEKYETPLGPTTQNISFDEKGDNKMKFTVGSSFKFAVVSLNVDYSFAGYNTVSLGLGADF